MGADFGQRVMFVFLFVKIDDQQLGIGLLGQWLNFKLFGITYLVGKISRSNFYFRVHWLSELEQKIDPRRILEEFTVEAPGLPKLFYPSIFGMLKASNC